MRHGSAAWGRSLAAGFVGLSGLATGSLELGELTGDGFLVGLGVLSAGAVLAIAAALSGRQSGTAARVVGYLLALPLAIGFWYLGGLVAQLAEALAMLALLNYLRSCVNDIWGPVQRWITVAQVGALLLLAMAGLALTGPAGTSQTVGLFLAWLVLAVGLGRLGHTSLDDRARHRGLLFWATAAAIAVCHLPLLMLAAPIPGVSQAMAPYAALIDIGATGGAIVLGLCWLTFGLIEPQFHHLRNPQHQHQRARRARA